MKQLNYYDFIKRIADDFNVPLTREYTLKMPAPIPAIKSFVRGRAANVRCFDGTNEQPFMATNQQRNNCAIVKSKELRVNAFKTLDFLIQETGLKLQTKSVRICEGGGWHSEGTRYIYKDVYYEN
jgi:hypothetical protein